MVETRQARRARQQQKLPVQPFAALDVFAGERFLLQLPEIVQTESTVPAVTTVPTVDLPMQPIPEPPKTNLLHLPQLPENTLPNSAVPMPVVPVTPNNDPSGPKHYNCKDLGIKLYAAKCYTINPYKKTKRIISVKK